jgi:hypothetical protein
MLGRLKWSCSSMLSVAQVLCCILLAYRLQHQSSSLHRTAQGRKQTLIRVVADAHALQAHINAEYSQLVAKLAAKNDVDGQGPDGSRWQFVLQLDEKRRNDRSISHRMECSIGPTNGSAGTQLLLILTAILKFHRNYAEFASLVARRRRCIMRTREYAQTTAAIVDDLHWYNPRDDYADHLAALRAADVIFANYASVLPLLYPTLFAEEREEHHHQQQQAVAMGARNRAGWQRRRHYRHHHHRMVAWLPHAATPEFFVSLLRGGDARPVGAQALLLSG